MGDSFSRIKKSTIYNRSTVVTESSLTNALNRYADAGRGQVEEALVALAEIVAASGSREAGELLDSFNEEISAKKPRKPVLRSLWDGLTTALPAILTTAKIAAIITPLFL